MKLLARFAVVAALLTVVGCGHRDPHPVTPRLDLSVLPTGLRWVEYQGIRIPIADQGPHRYSATAATGFADAPVGAALAAIVHTVRMSVAPDGTWAQIAASEIAPGRAADTWAAMRELFSITTPAERSTAPTILGYRITDYTPDVRAAVTIYSRYPDHSLSATRTHVVWIDRDWRLELAESVSTTPQVEAITEIPSSTVRLEIR